MARKKQTIADMVGSWKLAGVRSEEFEVPLPHFSHDAAVGYHLGTASDGEEIVDEADGLTLTIFSDGGFEEEGEATVPWYCADGVKQLHAVPFTGTIVNDVWLRANNAPVSAVPDLKESGVNCRLDDGDTQVADRLLWFGEKASGKAKGPERIIRTVNAVTDGLYVERIALKYLRA